MVCATVLYSDCLPSGDYIFMNGQLTTLERCVIVGVLIYLTIEVIVWIKYIM